MIALIAFVVATIDIYIYVLICYPLLFFILVLVEIMDKIIEKVFLKRH